jgi:hypothetical protein
MPGAPGYGVQRSSVHPIFYKEKAQMRTFKLTSALLAAAALLALATAGVASARVHHLRRNNAIGTANCRVTLNVAPHIVTSGETVLGFGQLACKPALAAGQTVTLYQQTTGAGGGFAIAGTTTTDSHGFYQVTTAALTANSTFYAIAGGDQSVMRDVKVAAQVTLVGPAEGKQLAISTGRHNAVMFTGTVTPATPGAEVVLQRQNSIKGNEWHRIARSVVTSNGTSSTYAIAHVFRVAGDSNIRVLIRQGKHTIASPSNVLSFEISQAQNPSLTIASSADPIAFGGTTTVSGMVAGEPNTDVTLMAHGAKAPFAAVATAKTDSTGAYSFTSQGPANSTFYRVVGSGRNSAVLYQGVKYVLTAAVSSPTVIAGSPLTYSGTVTPVEPGHVVYLERENASGLGFHVASTSGTENAAGEYSIQHVVFTAGTYTFRIKVPGGPDHGGTVSAPFTITVTPRTPGPLAPELPGNSGLPPQGTV